MSDFDNTVILYDEDGNEVEFEIVHFCEYKGEDKVFKRISEERHAAISKSLEKEEKQLKERYNEIQTNLSKFTQQTKSAHEFADLIEQYSPITKLDEVLLNTLIEKIIIHEQVDADGNKVMPIEIYYRFIGKVGNTY